MYDPLTILLGITALGTGVSAISARKSARAQTRQAGQAEQEALRLETEAKEVKAEEERSRTQATMRKLSRRRAVSGGKLRETILTSPLGVTGTTPTAQKTLLGL